MSKGKVLVAMSGGVDSSVTAALLKHEDYEVMGVTLRLWSEEDPSALTHQRRCCSLEDMDSARRVCQMLGVPHYILNFEQPFKAHVVDYFVAEYGRGRTPNPCLACNQWIKFRLLLERAQALGVDYLATGHYARIESANGRYRLLKAMDSTKDQSYVLYTLGQRELSRLLFPMGHITKAAARSIARELGLPNADKRDSQEICFVTEGDYRHFIEERIAATPGEVIDTSGHVLGRHRGVPFYTVGQRRGLGIAGGEPRYVVRLDAEANRVIVGSEAELYRDSLWATAVSYVSGSLPEAPVTIAAKIRYRSPEALALLIPHEDRAEVRFQQPQRAITPGQAVVFYHGEEVLGGGTIEA